MNTIAESCPDADHPFDGHPDDFVAFDHNAVLGGIDLFRARFTTRTTQPHAHSDFEIGVVGSGQRLVRCRGRNFQATGGSLVVFPPGEIHSGSPLDAIGSTYQSFLVSPRLLSEMFDTGAMPRFDSPVIQDPELAGQLAGVHAALEAGGWDTGREGELHDVLTRFTRRHGIAGGETRPEHEAVRQVRTHLEDFYGSRIRLGPLAASVNLSVFQLIRLFREATGAPPYAYLEQIRIDRAITMLRGGMAVSEVAHRTGFSDQSHLTRFFKRLTGVPPGRYRRSVLAAAGARGMDGG